MHHVCKNCLHKILNIWITIILNEFIILLYFLSSDTFTDIVYAQHTTIFFELN